MTCAGLAQLAVRAALAGEGPSRPGGGLPSGPPGGHSAGGGVDPGGQETGASAHSRHPTARSFRPTWACAQGAPRFTRGTSPWSVLRPRDSSQGRERAMPGIAPRAGADRPPDRTARTAAHERIHPRPFARRRGPRRAPNVVRILLDDVGCGAASVFGGRALFLDKGRPVCSNPFVAGRSFRPARRTADTRDGLRPWRRHGQGPRCHGPGGRGGPCHRQSRDHNAAAVLDQGDPGLRLRHRHAGRPAA